MRSVTLKSAITPSFMGRIATMLPGVRPSISFASLPTASTSPLFLLMATMDGSLTTIPLPLAKTSVLAVPRSMARSEENRLKRERKFMDYGDSQIKEGRAADGRSTVLLHGITSGKTRDFGSISGEPHAPAYPLPSHGGMSKIPTKESKTSEYPATFS